VDARGVDSQLLPSLGPLAELEYYMQPSVEELRQVRRGAGK
jgi:hypothetical protein